MAARSIASLSLSFGLVSIPVKLYSATESSAAVSFNLLHRCGSRVKQQYVCVDEGVVVDRADLIKGYEFEKDRYVTFEPAELKAMEEGARQSVDIVAFVPQDTVDPLYYDKAYFLAPDKRGAKPYRLLMEAMSRSGRCALARWAWKGKQHVVQIRPGEGGLVLQQLLFAEEVRSLKDLSIESAEVSEAELKLALQLIDQIAEDRYAPEAFADDEKARILAAIDAKIAGNAVVQVGAAESGGAEAQIIDLTEALRASLAGKGPAARSVTATAAPAKAKAASAEASAVPPRRPARRSAEPAPSPAAAPATAVAAAKPRARKAG